MPRKSRTLDHIHHFRKIKNPGAKVQQWICDHPDCYCIMSDELVKDKRSICTICHTTEILLDTEARRRIRPMCHFCSNSKQAIEKRTQMSNQEKVKSILEDAF